MPSTSRPAAPLGPTWEEIRTGREAATGWMHSGVAVLPGGDVLVAHPEGARLVRLGRDGVTTAAETGLTELHCLVLAEHRTGPVVWVADNGHRYVAGEPGYGEVRAPGRVVALRLDGTVVQELADPGADGRWSPTSVAPVDPADARSDVWVADGYGRSLLHRFSADGTLLATTDGSDSGVAFDCPHGLLVRAGGHELWVADRARRRLVVLDRGGAFLREVGIGMLDSPSSLAELDGRLLVTELAGSVAIFEGERHVGRLGSSAREPTEPGWPNRLDEHGRTVAPWLHDDVLNSPHGITAHDGCLYLTEWLIGGRVLRLRPSGPTTSPSTSPTDRTPARAVLHDKDLR